MLKTSAPAAAELPLLAVPSSVAVIEESRKAVGDKTIVLIQDAHTNESAQLNIARVLELLFENNKDIRTVFLEAGTGDDSLSFLREGSSRAQRERVASSHLKKAWIQGADYFDLLTDAPVQLWGVEDKTLYLEAIENYRAVLGKQGEVFTYLDGVERGIQTAKNALLNPRLLSFDGKCRLFDAGEVSFTDHVEFLYAEATSLQKPLSFYPHLHALRELGKKELAIDFVKATEEQIALVQTLGDHDRQFLAALSTEEHKPFILDASEHMGEKAFYEFLREKITDKSRYPNLSAYLDYLSEAQKIDAAAVLSEKEALETQIYLSLTRNRDEEKLIRASGALAVLRRLFKLTVSNKEFSDIEKDPRDYDIVEITGFINKKIMDLGQNYEEAVFILPSYDTAFQKAQKFYELTRKRDDTFLKNLLAKLESDKEKTAVLIAGGYHAENLKKLFAQNGISYISVRPQVLQETNQKRYESILLDEVALSLPNAGPGHIATLPGRELVVRDAGSPVRVVEALSRDFSIATAVAGARLAEREGPSTEREGEPVRLSEIFSSMPIPGLRSRLNHEGIVTKAKDVSEALNELEKATRSLMSSASLNGSRNRFDDTTLLLDLLTENALDDTRLSFFTEDDWVIYTYFLGKETAFLRNFIYAFGRERRTHASAQYKPLEYENILKSVLKRLEKLQNAFEKSLRTEEKWALSRIRDARYRQELEKITQKMKTGSVLLPVLLAHGWDIRYQSSSAVRAPKFDYRKSRTISQSDKSRSSHPFHPDSYDGILSWTAIKSFQNMPTPFVDLLKDVVGRSTGGAVWVDVGPGYGLALRQGKQMFGEKLKTYGVDLVDWTTSLKVRSSGQAFYWDRYGKDLSNPKNDYRFVRSSMETASLPEKADLITAFYSMPYSEDPLTALANFYNQLKPGGIFIASLFRYLVPTQDGIELDHSDWIYQIAQELSRQGVEAWVSGDVLMIRRKDEKILTLNLALDAPPDRDSEDRVHLKYVKIDPTKPVATLLGARLATADETTQKRVPLRQRFSELSYGNPSKTNLVLVGVERNNPEKQSYIKINLSLQGTHGGRQDLKELQAKREDKIRSELAKDSYLGVEDYLLRISPDGLWLPGELTTDDVSYINESLSDSKKFEGDKISIHKGAFKLEEGMSYTVVDEAMGESFEDMFGTKDTAKEIAGKANLQSAYEKNALRSLLDLVETHLVFERRGFYQRDGSEFETFRSPEGLIQLIDFGLASKLERQKDGSEKEVSLQESEKDPDLRIRQEEISQLKEHIFTNMMYKYMARDSHPSFRDLLTVYYIMSRFGNQLPVRSPLKKYLESKYAHYNPQDHETARWHLISLWMELRDLIGDGDQPVRDHWFDQLDTAVVKKQVTLEELVTYLTASLKVFSKVGNGRGAPQSGRPSLLTWRKGLAVMAELQWLRPEGFRWTYEEDLKGSFEEIDPKLDLLIHTFSSRKPGLDPNNEADRKIAFLTEYLALVARNWWIEQKLNADPNTKSVQNDVTSIDGAKTVSFFVGETIFHVKYSLDGNLIKNVNVTIPSRSKGLLSWMTRRAPPTILPNVASGIVTFFDPEIAEYVQIRLSEKSALLRSVKRDEAVGARLAEVGQIYYHGEDVKDLQSISENLTQLASSLDLKLGKSALSLIENEDGLKIYFKLRYQLAHGFNNVASQLSIFPDLGIFPQYSTLKNALDDLGDTANILLELSKGDMNHYQPISLVRVRQIATFSLARHVLSGIKSSSADKQFLEAHRKELQDLAKSINHIRARLFFLIGNLESHEVNSKVVLLERSHEWLQSVAAGQADSKKVTQFSLFYGSVTDAGGFRMSEYPSRYDGDSKTFLNYRIEVDPARLDGVLFKDAVSKIIEGEFGEGVKKDWERFFELERTRLSGARLAQVDTISEGELSEGDARRKTGNLLEHVVRNALAAITIYPRLYLKDSFDDENEVRQKRLMAFESLRSLKEFSKVFNEESGAHFRISDSFDMITIADSNIQGLEGIADGPSVDPESLKRLADFPAVSRELERLISSVTSKLIDFGMDPEQNAQGARKSIDGILESEKAFNEFLKKYTSELDDLPSTAKREEPGGALAVLRLLHYFHELRQGLILGTIPIDQAQERIQRTLRSELKKIFQHRNLYYYTVRQEGDRYFLKLLVREPADTVVSRFEGREVELHGEKKEILEQYLKDTRKSKRLLYYVPNRIEHFGYSVPMRTAVKSLFSLSPYVGKLHWQRLDMLLRDIVWYFPKAKSQKRLVSVLDSLSGIKNWLFGKGFGWVNKFMTVSVYGLIRVYLGASWAERINEILYVVIPDDKGRPVGLLMMHNWEVESERVTKLSVKQENLNKIAHVLGQIGSRSEALNEWQKEQADFLPYLRLKGNLHDLKNRFSVLMGWAHSTASFTKKRVETQSGKIEEKPYEDLKAAGSELEKWIGSALSGPRRQVFERPAQEYLRASKAVLKMRAALKKIEDPKLLEQIYTVTSELLATPSEEVLREIGEKAKAIYSAYPDTQTFFEDLISFAKFTYDEYSELMALRKAMHEDRQILLKQAGERDAFEAATERFLKAAETFERSLSTGLPRSILKEERAQRGLGLIREETQSFKKAADETLREWPRPGQTTPEKTIELKSVKIGPLILKLKRVYEGQFGQSQLHLKLEGIDEWAKTEVKADPEVLDRFLRELLTNAFKYSITKASVSNRPCLSRSKWITLKKRSICGSVLWTMVRGSLRTISILSGGLVL